MDALKYIHQNMESRQPAQNKPGDHQPSTGGLKSMSSAT